ncbi:MAG: lysophospholipid acyltransferase family protein [Chlorobiaceae bacterium]|nr:lysophospholipid acyltransferase family protein [Chlorobiaceae bacterium]
MSSLVEALRNRSRRRIRAASMALTFHAVNLLGVMIRRLGRDHAKQVACLLGDFIYRVLGLRRELVHRNLGITFPEKSQTEIRRIARGVYRNVASTLLEVLRIPLIRNRGDIVDLVDLDPGVYLRGTRNGQTGAVLVSAHYGNWELMALAFGLMVHPMTIIVKRLRNNRLDLKMNEYRTMRGNSIVYDEYALREGLRLLEAGGILAILGDQSDSNERYFGQFLGRRATMFHGAAFFALKARVPLFVGMCRNGDDGRYRIETQEIDTSDLTFNKEDIATLASRYTKVLEEYILRWPEEWFWLHDRWKRC